MVGMRLSTGLVLPIDIKTEIFPALVAELEEMPIQDDTTDLTVMDLHSRPIA